MTNSVYNINKGINRSIEFRGLRAQYIGYLAAGLVGLLILFAAMYVAGVTIWLCLPVVGGLGYVLFSTVYRLSRRYGEYGLLKETAYWSVPPALIARSRRCSLKLLVNTHNGKAQTP